MIRPNGAFLADSNHPFSFGDAGAQPLAECWEALRQGWMDERVRRWIDRVPRNRRIPQMELVPYRDDEVAIAGPDEIVRGARRLWAPSVGWPAARRKRWRSWRRSPRLRPKTASGTSTRPGPTSGSSHWHVEQIEVTPTRLRAVYARWGDGDFAASVPLFDEDVTFVVDREIPDGGDYRGHGRRAELHDGTSSSPGSRSPSPRESITEAGDKVLVRVHQTGIGRGSGVPVEVRYCHVWTFRDARVTRLEVIMSEDRARRAAGLVD